MEIMLNLLSLAELAERHRDDLTCPVRSFSIGDSLFDSSVARHLMGVVNLSADSWYRESVCLNSEAAIQRAAILKAQGASLVDVGAESSLAHAERIDALHQEGRLLPVVRGMAGAGILVSVETYHSGVARAALEAGAKVINLTGVGNREEIFRMVADAEAGIILCFVQGENVREVGDLELGSDPVGSLYEFFAKRIEEAERCGVKRIWIDPGLGFYYRNLQDSGARVRHQMEVFLNSFRLRKLGWPVCHALPHAFECFEEEVRCAEPFFAVLALLGQTDLLRTHEVARVRGVLKTMELCR